MQEQLRLFAGTIEKSREIKRGGEKRGAKKERGEEENTSRLIIEIPRRSNFVFHRFPTFSAGFQLI